MGHVPQDASPIPVEVLASAGLDLLCIEVEHAPFDHAEIERCVMAARAAALPVVLQKGRAPPAGFET